MNERRIRLACGDLSAEVAPDIGGALAWFRAGDHPLLRPELTSGPYAGRALGMACFPMVPFANRIARGRFRHAGLERSLACNVPEPHPLHGHGWQAAWTVREQDAHNAKLEFRGGPEWPWPYVAFEEFALETDALTIVLGFCNVGDEPAPVSLGLHPYLQHRESMLLEGRAVCVWERDPEGIPLAARPLPPDAPFNLPRHIARTGLDHCFDGWTGRAGIRWPDDRHALHIEARGCRCLHVYAPAAEDYVCLEPMTARPDAFNSRLDDLAPLQVVAPGESTRMSMRLRVESRPVSASYQPREAAAPPPPG